MLSSARGRLEWLVCLGAAAVLGAAWTLAEEPLVIVPAELMTREAAPRPQANPGQLPEQREPGLSGRRMVRDQTRRAILPSGAFMAQGEVAVGALSVSPSEATAKVLGLRDLEVQAEIAGLCARTTVKHVFQNETDEVLEGVFTFALPPGAAVDRFAMTILSENDLLEASLVESNRARSIYSELVYGRSIDPGLLEWLDSSLFRATIFPIPAHGTKTIVVSYLQSLPQSTTPQGRRCVQYCYPLLNRGVGQKAVPPASRTRLSALLPGLPQGAELFSSLPGTEFDNGRGQRVLDVELPAGNDPASHWFVTLEAPWAEAEGTAECSLQAHRPDPAAPGSFAVTLTPDLSGQPQPPALDLLFLLDTSASRTGAEYAGMLELTEAALRALRPTDRFAVLAFDIQPRILEGGWLERAPENIERSLAWLRRFKPLGATDLGAAFQAACRELAPGAKNPLRVVFVGDLDATFGERDSTQLPALVQGLLKEMKAELLCVWPGHGHTAKPTPAPLCLKGLADLSGGPVLKLAGEQRPAALGEALARNAGLPILRHARLEARLPEGTLLADLAPGILGGLAGNASNTFFGEYDRGGELTVTLRGELGARAYEKSWKVRLPDLERRNAGISKLQARARIEQLEGSGDHAQALALATRRGILCEGTAFLVLESEKMFRDYGIERGLQERMREKQLVAGRRGLGTARELATRAAASPNLPELKILDAATQLLNHPVEIEGVSVKLDLLGAEVPAQQQGRDHALTQFERLDRRQHLSRLIALWRGLPFEPEVVLPARWLEALPLTRAGAESRLEDRFAPSADGAVWTAVEALPATGKPEWKQSADPAQTGRRAPGLGAPLADTRFLLAQLGRPQKASLIQAAADGSTLQLDSHQLAHQLLGAILYGRDSRFWSGNGNSETRRAILTRRALAYNLRDLPAARLLGGWIFLAELALVEGQTRLAAELAERSLQLTQARSGSANPEARRAWMLLGLAQQLSGRFKEASVSYRRMLAASRPLSKTGRDLTYYALVSVMVNAGDREGATELMESWFPGAENKAELATQIGRMYLLLDRPADAIRAFSSKAEFDPLQAQGLRVPEDFLRQGLTLRGPGNRPNP